MQEIKVIFQKDKNNGDMKIYVNNILMPGIRKFNIDFNGKDLKFMATKLKTDRTGQFYVDENKDTAHEEVNFLNYFDPYYTNKEIVKDFQKIIDFDLHNIYLTSMLNAENYIKEMDNT